MSRPSRVPTCTCGTTTVAIIRCGVWSTSDRASTASRTRKAGSCSAWSEVRPRRPQPSSNKHNPTATSSSGRPWWPAEARCALRRGFRSSGLCPIVGGMEHRILGRSGLKVPVLSLGTATFAGKGDFFGKWGSTDVEQAKHLVDICLEAGVNLFDTADVYSTGAAEAVLGEAIRGRRAEVLLSTKASFSMGRGPNDKGSSRFHLTRALEASLKRLGTDYVDVYFMHGFDALTPVEETLTTLDDFVRQGKVRYLGCSNFSGWHVMK